MGDTQDKQASCHREGNLHCRTSDWKLGQAFVESRVKWTEASCLESKASAFNHILVQNTYTPFLDLRGTRPPWEACTVPFTPQVALSFCWVFSWLTFPPHAHILTGRSMANTVNSGWKLSWFLAHFFFQVKFLAGHLALRSGYHSAEPTVLVRFRPWCRLWGNICSRAQCPLVKFSFSLLKIRFLIFLLGIHHGSIFGNLTLSVTKNPSGWSC